MNPICDGMKITMGLDLFADPFTTGELADHYYELSADPKQNALLLEAATLEEIDDHYNPGAVDLVLEAIRIQRFSQTESKMKALVRVLNRNSKDGITAQDPVIGKPRKSGMFATVTVQVPMSDGQVVSIVFHSPTGDERKIVADDTIIAFRWLLNKRDITHAVSPERGKDVSLEQISKRVMQLVVRNSEAFQKKQGEVQAKKEELATVQADVDSISGQLSMKVNEVTELKADVEDIDGQIETAQNRLDYLLQENSDLEDAIAELKARKAEEGGAEPEPEPAPEPGEGETGGDEGEDDLKAKYAAMAQAAIEAGITSTEESVLLPWLRANASYDEDKEFFIYMGVAGEIADEMARRQGYQSEADRAAAEALRKSEEGGTGAAPKALAYIETEGDQTVKDALETVMPIFVGGGWAAVRKDAPDQADVLVESMILRFRNTLLAAGWKADEQYGWPLRKGDTTLDSSMETSPGLSLPEYILTLGADGKIKGRPMKYDQTMDQDPADLARIIDKVVKSEDSEPKPEVGVLPPAEQRDGMPAKRAAKILHSIGKAEAAMKEGFHIKLKSGAYQDLSIETHDDAGEGMRRIYFTQYIEEGGDLIIDSEMAFQTNIYTGMLKLAEIGYRGPMGEVRRTRVGRPEKSWANTFSKNLIDQGFEKASEAGEKTPEPEPDVPMPAMIPPEDLPAGWKAEKTTLGITYVGEFEGEAVGIDVTYRNDGKFNVLTIRKGGSIQEDHAVLDEAEANKEALRRMNEESAKAQRPEPDPNAGLNGYVAFYKGKRTEVWAKTSYEAQQKAAAFFKAKKAYDVTVQLAETGEPEPAPEPDTEIVGEPEAVSTLNDILAGKYDDDSGQIDALLDQAAAEIEAAGRMGEFEALLNQAADHYTEILRKEAA